MLLSAVASAADVGCATVPGEPSMAGGFPTASGPSAPSRVAALSTTHDGLPLWSAPLRVLPHSVLRVTRGPLVGSTLALDDVASVRRYVAALAESALTTGNQRGAAVRYDAAALQTGDAVVTLVLDAAGLAELWSAAAAAAVAEGLENAVRMG